MSAPARSHTGAARRGAVVLSGGAAGLVALVAAQAGRAARRRDLPTGADVHGAGIERVPGATRTLRMVAAGDSTLTGPGLADAGHVWIRQVARWVAAHELVDVEVSSVAVTGARVRDVVHQQVDAILAAAPDVVVVAVGTNDAVHFTPLRRVEADFRTLVDALVPVVPGVVIGGVGDLGGIARVPSPLADLLRMRGRAVDRVIRSVVRDSGAHYIDVSTVDAAFRNGGTGLFSSDLFHPNELGHALWARTAAPVIGHAARRAGAGERVSR